MIFYGGGRDRESASLASVACFDGEYRNTRQPATADPCRPSKSNLIMKNIPKILPLVHFHLIPNSGRSNHPNRSRKMFRLRYYDEPLAWLHALPDPSRILLRLQSTSTSVHREREKLPKNVKFSGCENSILFWNILSNGIINWWMALVVVDKRIFDYENTHTHTPIHTHKSTIKWKAAEKQAAFKCTTPQYAIHFICPLVQQIDVLISEKLKQKFNISAAGA